MLPCHACRWYILFAYLSDILLRAMYIWRTAIATLLAIWKATNMMPRNIEAAIDENARTRQHAQPPIWYEISQDIDWVSMLAWVSSHIMRQLQPFYILLCCSPPTTLRKDTMRMNDILYPPRMQRSPGHTTNNTKVMAFETPCTFIKEFVEKFLFFIY